MQEILVPPVDQQASLLFTLTRSHFFALFLVLVLVFAAFFPSLSNGFVNLDDPGYLLENPLTRDLSLKSVKAVFSTIYQAHYMPLVLLSFSVENHLFGMDPFVFHLNNVILHTANSFLVFLFIFLLLGHKNMSRSLAGNFWIALLTALLFGVHPLRVESVAWITERKDVLYAFFYLASLCAWLWCRSQESTGPNPHDEADILKKPGGAYPHDGMCILKKPEMAHRFRAHYFGGYLLALLLFLLALFSKGSAVTLPLVLLLIEGFQGRLTSPRSLGKLLPFLFFSVVFAAIAMKGVAGLAQTPHPPLFRFLIATHGAGFYVIKTLLPFDLSPHYPYPAETLTGLPAIFFLAPFFCIFLATACWCGARKSPLIGFGGLFYLLTIAPFLQWIPAGPVILALWFSYIPSIGLSLICALLIRETWLRLPPCSQEDSMPMMGCVSPKKHGWRSFFGQIFLLLLLGAFILSLTLQTRGRCIIWSDSVTLWNEVIERDPCFFAYINRGQGFHERGKLPEALKDFKKAQEMAPTSELALNGLGRVYRDMGDASQALALFEEARKHNPRSKDAANNIGLLLLTQDNPEKAIPYFDEAINLDREFSKAWNNRGTAFRNSGRLEESLADIDKALELYPNAGPMFLNRALTLSRLGKKDAARDDLQRAKALGIKPTPDLVRQILQ